MCDRRSSRARKEVDYAKFSKGDEDSPLSFFEDDGDDEDFAEPAPKKQKRDKLKKKEKNKPTSTTSSSTTKVSKAKNRPALDENLYQRDLLLALELSAVEHGLPEEDAKKTVTSPPKLQHQAEVEAEHTVNVRQSELPVLARVADESEGGKENIYDKKSNNVTVVSDVSDTIEILEENITSPKKKSSRKRRASKTKYTFDESDSEEEASEDDFNPAGNESASDSEDEFCPGDDDSDFDDGSQKKPMVNFKKDSKPPVKTAAKPNKKPAVSKQAAPVSSTSSTPRAGINRVAGMSAKMTPKTSSEEKSSLLLNARSPGTSLHKKFTPPTTSGKSPGLGGINIKSPGGSLRLGLSRKIKLKPLHANVKVPQ